MTNKEECQRNYFRLVRVTMIEGTRTIRKTVLDQLPQTLHMMLKQKEQRLRGLNTGQRSVISNHQLEILYPPYGNCDLAAIDMTLWCVLARNLISLPRTVTSAWHGDDNPPLPGQEEWYHDITRIRLTRNKLFHLQHPELDNETFEDLWKYVSGALHRLDQSIDFESYRTAEYDRIAAREFEIQVKEQVLQETNDVLRAELGGRRRFLRIITAIGVLIIGVLIATNITVVTTCHQETPCGRGVRRQIVGISGPLYFVPRSAWGAAQPFRPYKNLNIPVSVAMYSHTADTSKCFDTQECCNQVKKIQYLHMHDEKPPYVDIGYHYLIDGKGYVYEGTPTDKETSNRLSPHNYTVASIALIGNFMYESPTPDALGAFDVLLEYLTQNTHNRKMLTKDFTLYALCERYDTYSPGINLYNAVNNLNRNIFPHITHHLGYGPLNCTFGAI